MIPWLDAAIRSALNATTTRCPSLNFGSVEKDKQPLREGMTLTYEPPHGQAKKSLRTHFEDIVLVNKGEPIVLNELAWDFLW